MYVVSLSASGVCMYVSACTPAGVCMYVVSLSTCTPAGVSAPSDREKESKTTHRPLILWCLQEIARVHNYYIRMLMRDEEGKEERSKQGHSNNKATCTYVCVRPALLTYSTNIECLLASIIIFVAYPCSYVLTHIQLFSG